MKALSFLLVVCSLAYGDWPQYLQNSQHSSFSPYSNQSMWCPANSLWRETNIDVWNIISSGDVLYTVSLGITGNSVAARDVLTYDLKWETNLSKIKTVPAFSSLTSLLYVATDEKLYALNVTTGAVQWSATIDSPAPTYLILQKDLVIVSTYNFVDAHIVAFYDSWQPKLAMNITMPDICLEMVASPNNVLFTLISESLTSFSLSALNLTNGEFLWSNKTVYVPNWFDFISLSNGNLVLNNGDSFTIFQETTGDVVLNKQNFVLRGTSSDFLYCLNVTGVNGRYEVFADGVAKMDFSGNVLARYDFDMIITSSRIVLDGDKALYVAGQGQNEGKAYFFAFDIETTDKLWSYTENDINAMPVKHIQLILNGGNVIGVLSYQTIFSLASCGSHGACNVDTRICECNNAWHGDSCGICNNNCTLHGSCNDEGQCVCEGNWQGEDCDSCTVNWSGDNCEVCTKDCGHGTCDATGACVCDKTWHTAYHGENCQNSKISGGVIALIVLGALGVIIVVAIGVWKFQSRNKASYEVLY